MRRFRYLVFLACLAPLALGGCRGPGKVREMTFDGAGWGGPNLKYTADAAAKTLRVEAGMLVNRDFRWAGSEFAFEFFDMRELVWGVRLMDLNFAPARYEALRKTWMRLGEKKFVVGAELTAEQLWKFDTVLEAEFHLDKVSRIYKVLDVAAWGRLDQDGKEAERISGTHEVPVRQNSWNSFRATVVDGKLTYWVNGEKGRAVIELDPRTNGRLGIFVVGGAPLQIRKLTLGTPSW